MSFDNIWEPNMSKMSCCPAVVLLSYAMSNVNPWRLGHAEYNLLFSCVG